MTQTNLDTAVINLQLQEEEQIAQTAAKRLGLTYVKLISYPILPEVLRLIPEDDAAKLQLVVYLKAGPVIKVATALPPTKVLNDYLQALATKTKCTIKLSFCSELSMSYALTLYVAFQESEQQKKQAASPGQGVDYRSLIKSLGDIANQLKKVSTTELLDLVFAGAVILNASDIHLEPSSNATRLRFRIDGILQDVGQLTMQQYRALASRIKNQAKLKLDVLGAPQDGRFELKVLEHMIDVRVSTLPASFGEDVVMRLLQEDVRFLHLEELAFNPVVLSLIKESIHQPHGMILNTGPTGSGKTTTLYAILSSLNRPEAKIITIEDPVEYRLPGINQIQVNPAANLTFAAALRSALRQDPDIIMVGEIRDSETAQIALQAALTGHLVLATLHTNSAPAAIPRLLEMGIEPYLLAGSINLVIAQRLVRKRCGVCKGKGGNCTECSGSGYKGRVPIVEALKPTEEFNELISKKASIDAFEHKAKALGMQNMLEDGMAKVAAGLTTESEVERVAREI